MFKPKSSRFQKRTLLINMDTLGVLLGDLDIMHIFLYYIEQFSHNSGFVTRYRSRNIYVQAKKSTILKIDIINKYGYY